MAHALHPSGRRLSPDRRRSTLALLASLLIHALLLSLAFGGQGHGFPGFGLPWQTRRVEVPELRVLLVPARVAAAGPSAEAGVAQPLVNAPTLTAADPQPAAGPRSEATTPARTEQSTDTLAPSPRPDTAVIALARPDEAKWVVPALPTLLVPPVPPVMIAAAPAASSPETAMPALREAVEVAQARALELAQLDRARLEAQQLADQQVRQLARQLAQQHAQQQADKLEAERQEAARQQALRSEAARLEAARSAADQEATRQATARQEAARQEAARQDAARAEAASADAARVGAAQAEVDKREAKLRAIGRQLNEEADRRDAAAAAAAATTAVAVAAARPPLSHGSARRGRLFGRSDANAELVLYAEAWSRKIQLNMTFDSVREAAKQPHTAALVTVAIRSDGSVESVSFISSSGVAAIDEAIRRIVQSQANYPAFPPGLAREFDVIEIRRTWHFDMAIRLD